MIKKILCLVSSALITTPVVLLTQVSCANNKNNSFFDTELLSVPSSKTNTIDVYASEISNEFNNNPSILNQYLNDLQFSNKPKDARIIFSNLVSNDVLGTLSFDVSLDKSYSNGSLLNSPKVFGNFTIKNFKKKNLDSIKSTNLKETPRISSTATSILPSDLSTSNLINYILNINSSDILNLPSDATVSYKINSFDNKFGSVNFSVVVNKYYDEDGNLVNKSKTLITITISGFKVLQNGKKTSVLINPPTVKNFNISVGSIKKDLEQNPNNISKYINPPKFFDQPTGSNIVYKNFKYHEGDGIFAFDCGLSSYYDENGNLVNNEKIFNTYSFSNFLVNIQNETNIDNYLDTALSIPLSSTLLPSEVVNINNSSIKDGYILLNRNIANFSLTSYDLLSFDDTQGTLSLKMNYKYNNQSKSKIFNFNKFKKFSFNNVSIKVTDNGQNTLSAYDISNNQNISKNYCDTTLKNNGISLDFYLNGSTKLGNSSYSFDNIKVSGFNESWFTNNNDINLNFNISGFKLNYYSKLSSNSSIESKSYNLSQNISFNIKFPSACDFLVLNTTLDNNLARQNFIQPIEYYFADDKWTNDLRTSDPANKSLKLIKNSYSYNNKNYEFVVKLTSLSNFIINGNNSSMDLNFHVVCKGDNQESLVQSIRTKTFTINSLKTTGFAYSDSEDKINKFSVLFSDDKKNEILNKFKYNFYKNTIDSSISSSQLNDVLISKIPSNNLEKILASGMKYYYNNLEIFNTNGYYATSHFTTDGTGIAVENIYTSDYSLYYDKNLDNFYVKLKLDIQTCNNIISSNNFIKVYITNANSWKKNGNLK